MAASICPYSFATEVFPVPGFIGLAYVSGGNCAGHQIKEVQMCRGLNDSLSLTDPRNTRLRQH